MATFLTTSQIAAMYGLADSTIRHYRASGRLVPARRTPGGHARYARAEVIAALGEPAEPQAGTVITGIVSEDFAPPGLHDLRSSGRSGMLAAEVVALGAREVSEPADSDGPYRWGGRLLKARRRVAV